jgi:predicted phage terminase large subunit-like protein
MANYPDSNFIYTSYGKTLAQRQTQTVREIVALPAYRKIFGIEISQTSSAKDDFKTLQGGNVYAAGAGGTITGMGAGIKGCKDRFGGAFLIDDIHKPDEVTSDTIRQRDNAWFDNTAQSRLNNGDNTPMIFIGQRLHEDDLPSNLIQRGDWETLIIPALDSAGNALVPELHSTAELLKMKEREPYVFSSQYQQNPLPAGGGLYKRDWLTTLDVEPTILATFITADTAETDKTYNDATVFSFWGIYKIKHGEVDTNMYALHWLDCVELRVEPKDLQNEFMQFYASCMRYRVKPTIAAIEKKSTGTTLISTLKDLQGLRILEIERNASSGSKTTRFLKMQPYIATKRVTLPTYGKHTSMCIEHCTKITGNNTHRHDDIFDTAADAIQLALIDETIIGSSIDKHKHDSDLIIGTVMRSNNTIDRLRRARKW